MTLQQPTIPDLVKDTKFVFGGDVSPQLAQIYDGAYKFLLEFDYQNLISDLKTIAIIATVILVAIMAWIIVKIGGLYKNQAVELVKEINPPAEVQTAYNSRWDEIRRHVNSFVEAEWKLAVIEGDKFVDDVLKTAGFPGESMGERLMLIKPDQIMNLQYLWDAHKLRNLLVHDPHFRLTHQQAVFAINAYESVLRELGGVT